MNALSNNNIIEMNKINLMNPLSSENKQSAINALCVELNGVGERNSKEIAEATLFILRDYGFIK